MIQYLNFLLTPLLEVPDKLSVTEKEHIVTIDVEQSDLGRVIGKAGVTIRSIRTLAKTYCALNNYPQVTIVLNSPPKA